MKVWAIARYDFQLSEEEFHDMTFEQFHYLADRVKENERRLDRRAALICSVIANVNRNKKKRSKPYGVEDFMPREKKKQTWQQQLKFVEGLTRALGGKDLR